MIAKSLNIFHELTCVRIIARTTESDYVVIKRNAGSLCSSHVGMQGGRQSMTLAERCVKRPGSTVHEMMHVLGFHHEQCREDRDNFVNVFFDNIKQGKFDISTHAN